MQKSPHSNNGRVGKRTRAHVGTTNRKQREPDIPTPEPQPTKTSSPKPPDSTRSSVTARGNSVTNPTASFMAKVRKNETKETKEKKEMEKTQLDTLKCKFVECFEDGKEPLQTGTTYMDDTLPPTRFSCAPPPHDSFHVTTSERGTSAFATDQERLTTTYSNHIATYSPKRRGEKPPEVYNENTLLKAELREREEGRLARIRGNNARVEAVAHEHNEKLLETSERHVATVKKQQEKYAESIAFRQARGFD